MKIVQLILPVPPSVNHIYKPSRTQRGARILTNEALDFKRSVRLAWLKAGRPTIGRQLCRVNIYVQFKDKRRRDTGNLEKLLFDSLNKPGKKVQRVPGVGLWDDDVQVVDHRWIKCKSYNPGRILVEIQTLPDDYELPSLFKF